MVIEYIRYQYGMINKPSQRKKLAAWHLEQNNIPSEIATIIENKDIMSVKGTIGSKEGATPIEYEQVMIRAEGKETTFEVYNRGMSMFVNETPELKKVFELCSRLRNELRL